MPVNNAFLDFLRDNYYDLVSEKARLFLISRAGRKLLEEKFEDCYAFYVNDLEDVRFMFVRIQDEGGDSFSFDLVVEADVHCEFTYRDGVPWAKGGRDSDAFTVGFIRLSFSASIGDGELENLRFLGSGVYDMAKPTKPMDGNFVPVISRAEYGAKAEAMLRAVYPDCDYPDCRIDVDSLAERLGCTVIRRTISADHSIFGQYFFGPATVEMAGEDGNPETVRITGRTIVIDPPAAAAYSLGSVNVTIAHELVHAFYHDKALRFAKMIDRRLTHLECERGGASGGPIDKKGLSIMEAQANGIAPHVLMPDRLLERKYGEVRRRLPRGPFFNGDSPGLVKQAIRELADFFKVSMYSVKNRLIDLGKSEAAGVFNYVDGGFAKPFSFRKGALDKGETFTVSAKDVAEAVQSDPALSPIARRGELAYVDSFLVLDDPRFVAKDSEGRAALTAYALSHMDECAVKFSVKPRTGSDAGAASVCYLCRDSSKFIEFDVHVEKDQKIFKPEEVARKYEIHEKSKREMCDGIRNLHWKEILPFLMEYADISPKELAADSGIHLSTVEAYKSKGRNQFDKKTFVALFRALNVPFEVAEIAMRQAGISLANDKEGNAYRFVLQSMRKNDYKQVDEYLTSCGVAPLIQKGKNSAPPPENPQE